MQTFAHIYRDCFGHLDESVSMIWNKCSPTLAKHQQLREKFDGGWAHARPVLRIRSEWLTIDEAKLFLTSYEVIQLDNDGNFEPPYQPGAVEQQDTVSDFNWMGAATHYGVSVIQNVEEKQFDVQRQNIQSVMPMSVGYLQGIKAAHTCEALAALHSRMIILAEEDIPETSRALYTDEPLTPPAPSSPFPHH